MKNSTQLDRYTSLLDFLDKKFKECITIHDIEKAKVSDSKRKKFFI